VFFSVHFLTWLASLKVAGVGAMAEGSHMCRYVM
jgi:hypothetical protein